MVPSLALLGAVPPLRLIRMVLCVSSCDPPPNFLWTATREEQYSSHTTIFPADVVRYVRRLPFRKFKRLKSCVDIMEWVQRLSDKCSVVEAGAATGAMSYVSGVGMGYIHTISYAFRLALGHFLCLTGS